MALWWHNFPHWEAYHQDIYLSVAVVSTSVDCCRVAEASRPDTDDAAEATAGRREGSNSDKDEGGAAIAAL